MITKTARDLLDKEAALPAAFGKVINGIRGVFAKTPPANQGAALADVAGKVAKKTPTFGQRFKRGAVIGGVGTAFGAGVTYNNYKDQLTNPGQMPQMSSMPQMAYMPPPMHFQSLPQPSYYR